MDEFKESVELAELKTVVMKITTPAKFANLISRLYVKETYDQQSFIIEINFAQGPVAVALRTIFQKVVIHDGGVVHCGAPPPSAEERALRKAIEDLREELGYGKKKGGDKRR